MVKNVALVLLTIAILVLLVLVMVFMPAEPDTRHKVNGYVLTYSYDPRGDVCLIFSGYSQTSIMAAVPCTDKVLKAIEQDKK